MRLLRLYVIFHISLISFFHSIWSVNLVDFDIFVSKTLSTSFSIDFEMVRIFHFLRRSAIILSIWVQTAQLLLCLFLVENVQVGPVGSLNGDNQALIVRDSLLSALRVIVVPDG